MVFKDKNHEKRIASDAKKSRKDRETSLDIARAQVKRNKAEAAKGAAAVAAAAKRDMKGK